MRRHYESLNYLDGQHGSNMFRFTRTQGATYGFIAHTSGSRSEPRDITMTQNQIEALRDMLNEVLEDWKA